MVARQYFQLLVVLLLVVAHVAAFSPYRTQMRSYQLASTKQRPTQTQQNNQAEQQKAAAQKQKDQQAKDAFEKQQNAQIHLQSKTDQLLHTLSEGVDVHSEQLGQIQNSLKHLQSAIDGSRVMSKSSSKKFKLCNGQSTM